MLFHVLFENAILMVLASLRFNLIELLINLLGLNLFLNPLPCLLC
jgi:hypothetical protein